MFSPSRTARPSAPSVVEITGTPAAIVSRELGLPAIVGTGNATEVLHSEQDVTVSCAEGELGFVYEGFADYEGKELDLADIPETRTRVMEEKGEK